MSCGTAVLGLIGLCWCRLESPSIARTRLSYFFFPPNCSRKSLSFSLCNVWDIVEGSLEVKLPTIWTDGKAFQLQPPLITLHSTPLHPTTTTTTTTLHYTTLITLHYTTLNCTTLHYTTLDYTKLQLQLQLHYTTTTAALHHTTSYYIQQLWVRWPTRWPLQPW